MELTYVIDYVFRETPDGIVWTDTSYDFPFWQPYLSLYSEVTLLCRVEQVEEADESWKQVNGPGVEIAGLPAYNGALEYLLCAGEVKTEMRRALASAQMVILRMPSNLGRLAAQELRGMKHRYAVDVVGDPAEALAAGIVKMPGRALLRSIFTRAQKAACATASGVAYVADTLQAKYPAASGAATLVCSDVRLEGEWLAGAPRAYVPDLHRRLITVATLSQCYKGIDVLLRALRICHDQHFNLSLTIVGTGRYQSRFERQATALGLAKYVTFAGAVPWGAELIGQLDAADIFVLASRVEVMPRALLEAMARGLPAIATDVGAVHEVLCPDALVVPGDAAALAHTLIAFQLSSRRLESLSEANLAMARQFAPEVLRSRWESYQQELLRVFNARDFAGWRKVARPAVI